jgi:hypothetical protein
MTSLRIPALALTVMSALGLLGAAQSGQGIRRSAAYEREMQNPPKILPTLIRKQSLPLPGSATVPLCVAAAVPVEVRTLIGPSANSLKACGG